MDPKAKTAHWLQVIGVVFAGLGLLFFMALVAASIFGWTVPPEARFFVVIVLAITAASAFSFWGGSAILEGKIPIPYVQQHPLSLVVGGGVAVLFLVLLFGYWLYLRPAIPERVISGSVVDAQNNEVIEGALVTVFLTGRTTTTTADGRFRIPIRAADLESDASVVLTVSRHCYATRELRITPPEDTRVELRSDRRYAQGRLRTIINHINVHEPDLTVRIERSELEDLTVYEELGGCTWQDVFATLCSNPKYGCLVCRIEEDEIVIGLQDSDTDTLWGTPTQGGPSELQC